MSEQGGQRSEQALTPQEAARLLRQLAEQLERGVLILERQEVRLEHALVLEQSLKPEDQGLAYKLKLKYKPAEVHEHAPRHGHPAKEPVAPAAGPDAPAGGFKELKRSLSRPFKEVRAALEGGGLPAPDTARGLWQTCRRLAEQVGGQDPGFLELERQASLLLQAVEKGDQAQASQAAAAMARLKSDCHAKKA